VTDVVSFGSVNDILDVLGFVFALAALIYSAWLLKFFRGGLFAKPFAVLVLASVFLTLSRFLDFADGSGAVELFQNVANLVFIGLFLYALWHLRKSWLALR